MNRIKKFKISLFYNILIFNLKNFFYLSSLFIYFILFYFNLNLNLKDNIGKKTLSKSALKITDKNLNELCSYQLERYNEICYSFCVISSPDESYLKSNNSTIFALGTAILHDNFREPELGYLSIIELTDKFKFNKLCEMETRGAIYKVASVDNILYCSIASCFYAYKFVAIYDEVKKKENKIDNKNNSNKMLIDLDNNIVNDDDKNDNNNIHKLKGKKNENKNENKNSLNENFKLELIKRINEFYFIYDFICFENFILISDMYKSVSLWKYEKSKDNIIEMTRDFNPLTCNSLVKSDNLNIISVSDLNNNIYNLSYEDNPKSDEDRFM